MSGDAPVAAGLTPTWLQLREPADAAARAEDLVARLRPGTASGTLTVHDLGSGTGSMARWLAPRLAGPQHWVLHDREAGLLAVAEAGLPGRAADGSPVTGETRVDDVTRLGDTGLAGAGLVTASALLDMLTADEVGRLVSSCVAAGCPALLTLSVVGRVELDPADALDAEVGAAFDDHQRRTVAGRRLLGPDAASAAVDAFRSAGWEVETRPSPWRLGPAEAGLAVAWLEGWVAAAIEKRPALAAGAAPYLARRLAAATDGTLRVEVGHADLLALPRGSALKV